MSVVNDFEFYKDGALGDQLYRSASGLYVKARGTPAVGKAVVVASDGIPEWTDIATQAELAAASGNLPVWSPHKAPASANALDVEFASSSSISAWPAGWSAASGGDFLNAVFPATDPGRFSTTDTGGGWKGRVAAVPAGDFNLAMYVQVFGPNATFTLAAVGVHTAGTIALPNVNNQQFYAGYHSTFGGYGLGAETSSGFLVSWGVQHIVPAHGVVIYVRRVGGNYFYGWTPDGLKGIESTAATPSGVTHISVGAYSSQGGMSVIRWVRVVSSSGARQSWGGLL